MSGPRAPHHRPSVPRRCSGEAGARCPCAAAYRHSPTAPSGRPGGVAQGLRSPRPGRSPNAPRVRSALVGLPRPARPSTVGRGVPPAREPAPSGGGACPSGRARSTRDERRSHAHHGPVRRTQRASASSPARTSASGPAREVAQHVRRVCICILKPFLVDHASASGCAERRGRKNASCRMADGSSGAHRGATPERRDGTWRARHDVRGPTACDTARCTRRHGCNASRAIDRGTRRATLCTMPRRDAHAL